jgi:integrase
MADGRNALGVRLRVSPCKRARRQGLRRDGGDGLCSLRGVMQAGERARLPVKTYAHQLRHACGYYLANKGSDLRLIQDYWGHKQIQNTVRYTALNPARFAGLW